MNFTHLTDFVVYALALRYGRVEDVAFDIDPDELRLEPDHKLPLRRFVEFLREHEGSVHFEVLKIQDGLPMHGETQFRGQKQAVQSHKFA